MDMNKDEINFRIQQELCRETIKTINNVDSDCFEYKSFIKNKNELEDILRKHSIEKNVIDKIIEDYKHKLIPPGSKATVRGNKFNIIIKNYIIDMNLDKSRYDFEFERKTPFFNTDEIPDWYIHDKFTKKTIVGMNQVDLWGGGHQTNRASKYLNDKNNSKDCKILCVVANETKIETYKSKKYNIFNTGFKNDTLCYLGNLKNIVKRFFA